MAAAMNCEAATDLLALDSVGALERAVREEMDRHVADCPTCRPLAAQYADVVSLLPAALEPVPPPARLRRNLMAQVYGEATAMIPSPWWRRLIAAIPASRALTAAGAVALVAAIALGVWGWGMAGHRAAAGPVAYDVSGTTATGTLTVNTTGTASVLSVRGLSPLPGTETYEVWLIPAHGAPQGVAFLSPGISGNPWTAVLTTSLIGYKTIAATVEPTGGSPTPSNTEVLSGQLAAS
jgi:anti-sigma-K factor RskA